ncbi:hypothetical protein [Yeosuana sp.]|uniref:hypothetical protein n=1 Tax=Yeosuana sp. TaxID=2529388 RepID=UPI004055168D
MDCHQNQPFETIPRFNFTALLDTFIRIAMQKRKLALLGQIETEFCPALAGRKGIARGQCAKATLRYLMSL